MSVLENVNKMISKAPSVADIIAKITKGSRRKALVSDISVDVQQAFRDVYHSGRWEEIYKGECLSAKSLLERQVDILRNDPNKQGQARFRGVIKQLRKLSNTMPFINGLADGMAGHEPDCKTIRKAPRGWFFADGAEPLVDEACIVMECQLDTMAFNLINYGISSHLTVADSIEQVIKELQQDFLQNEDVYDISRT